MIYSAKRNRLFRLIRCFQMKQRSFFLVMTISAMTAVTHADWVAYNDLYDGNGGTAALGLNVTTHTYQDSGMVLVDFATGAPLPVTMTGEIVGDASAPDVHNSGGNVNANTDADDAFGGILDLTGMNELDNTAEHKAIIFNGLDPLKTYAITLTANRSNSSYTDRWAKVTIEGADAFTYAASAGVDKLSEASGEIWVGYNTVNGHVMKWTNISCGADGSFTIKSENAGRGGKGYAMMAFKLEETLGVVTSPANGATNVPIETDLTWSDPADPNADEFIYDVYFGTMADPNCDLNPKVVSNADVNTYVIPGDLGLGTTYYWQVDVIDPNGGNGPFVVLASSGCLSFTTVPPTPVITQQPVDQFVFSGESASFTVAATSVSDGPFYQWYQTGDPDVLLTGETDPTLTINPATTGDIGGYFCRISNSGGTVDSDVAQLDIKRCLYHWPLDGDAIEANGTGFDGVPESSDPNSLPTYTAGRIDQAVSLDDTLEQQIRVSGLPISITGEASFTCWVSPADISKNFAGILSKWGDGGGSTHTFWFGQLNTDGGVRFSVYPTGGETAVDSINDALADGEWTYLACTYDGAEMRIYANGELRGVLTFSTPFDDRFGDLLMGNVPAGNNWYAGLIDDVKVYNYGLTQAEVAADYNTLTGETVCVRDADSLTTSPLAPGDVNEDCVVDVLDFVLVSQRYLQSTLLP